MPTYQGIHDRYTIIQPARASGGEGEIFNIRGRKDLVLKRLIDKHRTTTREKKLEAMLRAAVPQNLLGQLTWPVDIVYENGKFIGYVMPALHKVENLNAMYSDKYSPSLSDRLIIAMNLCVPVDGLHQLGQYVGDGNPQNICVDPKTLEVIFVDTDSYTIRDRSSGRIYPCEVALPEYLAPEVQAALQQQQHKTIPNLPPDTFNEYTDRFWLAVHIFALLMNNTHPFAVRKGGKVSIPHMSTSQTSVPLPLREENICRGFFPHTMHRSGLDIPVNCPKFSYLPDSVQNLFIRAFVDGHTNPASRPSAAEWFQVLAQMQQSLKRCTRNPKHQYPASASFCPWCELSSRQAPKPVVRKTGSANGSSTSYGTSGTGTTTGGGTMGKPSRPNPGCLGLLGSLLAGLLSLALLMALPVACTANMMDIHRSEEAARQEANRQKLEELREKAEANQQAQGVQLDGPAEYDSGMQADGSWIHPHDGRILQVNAAGCHNLNGRITNDIPEVEFYLETGDAGVYNIQTFHSDLPLYVYVYDDMGRRVASYISEKDGDCVALQMDANARYTLKAEQRFSEIGTFQLRWWTQKPCDDITNYGAVHDAMEFNGQENVYLFRCSASKEYRFCFTQLAENLRMNIYVYDAEWNRVASSMNVIEGYGPYADLQMGQEYYIKVLAHSGSGDYTLDVQQVN